MTGSPADTGVPVGFTVVLDDDTRYADGGTVVWGGAPRRLLRLTPDGAGILRGLAAGEPVEDRRAGALARRLVETGIAFPRPPRPEDRDGAALEVVVPARDRPDDLAECLRALNSSGMAGSVSVSVSVTVVDDASRDAAAVAEVAAHHGAALVRLDHNVGPAGARNAGLAATDAPIVAFVDSDCRLGGGELQALAAHLADPRVAIAAPRVRPLPGAGSVLDRYAEGRSPLDLGPRPATVRPDGRVTYVPATVLVARRSAVEGVGGFDPALRYGEDVDLVWRLVDAGWAVRYDPAVTARHHEPTHWSSWLDRRFRYGTSAGPLAARHGGRLGGPPLSGLVAPFALAHRLGPAGSLPPAARREVAAAPVVTALGLLRWGLPLWWPVALVGARRPAVRRALAVAAGLPLAAGWVRRRPVLDPLRAAAATVGDEVAYGAGVWAGCVRAGNYAPLLPRLRGGQPVSGSRRLSSP